MLDYRGQVAEATGANVFFVKDGVIHTPIPDFFLTRWAAELSSVSEIGPDRLRRL